MIGKIGGLTEIRSKFRSCRYLYRQFYIHDILNIGCWTLIRHRTMRGPFFFEGRSRQPEREEFMVDI